MPAFLSPSAPPRSGERWGRVLIVDDDARVAQTITRILSRDHEVTAVDRAAAALELITRGVHFDVILCDLMMPEMTGEAFYTRLELEVPERCARIVFLTAGALTAEVEAFLRSVGRPCLEKPFSVDELRRVVAEAMR